MVSGERKVKDILGYLPFPRLRKLCSKRKRKTSGARAELETWLARSYQGNVKVLVESLSREDLVGALKPLKFTLDGRSGRLTYLAQAKREQLQEVAERVYGENWEPDTIDDTPALDGCPIRIAWSTPETEGEGRDVVFSTNHGSAGFTALGYDALRAELDGARALSIASAYYDTRFFDELFKPAAGLGKFSTIRIVLNGLAGARLNSQVDELAKIRRKLRKRSDDVEIRLVFSKAIFHTKLFLIRKHGSRVALVGSANATDAAMCHNEELLFRVTNETEPLEAYFDHVWDNEAEPLEEREGRARTLVNFFRTGVLYFKSSTSFQANINPFSELLNALPKEALKKLTNVNLRYSEPKAGLGPFDLQTALGVEDSPAEHTNHRASIKPYSVETCFGYWVPQALTATLEDKLKEAAPGKRTRLDRISAALESIGDDALESAYEDYIRDAKQIFADRGITIPWDELRTDPFKTQQWFRSRIERLRTNLKNEEYVERLSNPFRRAVMPEIWGDPVAYTDFENSFFEYLAYVSTLRTKSWVPARILDRAGFRCEAESRNIHKGLKAYLHDKDKGWHDQEDWALKPR